MASIEARIADALERKGETGGPTWGALVLSRATYDALAAAVVHDLELSVEYRRGYRATSALDHAGEPPAAALGFAQQRWVTGWLPATIGDAA